MNVKTDIEIARGHALKPIAEIAKGFVPEDALEPYGRYKAKVTPDPSKPPRGKLILVTAINPTSAGEGKTTVSIGLADGMKRNGKEVALALREPSLGPVFGVKGGAAGGGYSQILPMDEINLHFTGDLHAITSANNLLSAMIDNHLHQGNPLRLNPKRIAHRRCMDLNDRALRGVVVGLGKPADGVMRQESFDITAASEVMAILCLAQDAEDLKRRLANVVVGYNDKGEIVTCRDLGAHEAMAILLKEAVKPNLVQTLGGVPALVHGGPFANIAHGCNSVIATKTALANADYVVTEAGFGADLGAEKFLDVKCRLAGLSPDAVAIVATVRALKLHGGAAKETLGEENLKALSAGFSNLKKHVENVAKVFGLSCVVAINRFTQDTDKELKLLSDLAAGLGVPAVCCNAWAEGGEGCRELAQTVCEIADRNKAKVRFAYELTAPVKEKFRAVATRIYGADNVVFSEAAEKAVDDVVKKGYGDLPVLIAKTQYSLSDDPRLLGAPTNFTVTIRDVMLKAGAGFLVGVAGDMMLMPGLPKTPAAVKMTIDKDGAIEGLF